MRAANMLEAIQKNESKGQPMTDKPVTTYVVSVFEAPDWRTVLTTEDKAKVEACEGRRYSAACLIEVRKLVCTASKN
jgi:hypothetical protein